MRLYAHFARHWPALLAGGLALGALALLWRVRDTPLVLGSFAQIDALSAFFLLGLFGGAALALVARLGAPRPRLLRQAAAAAALSVAYSTTLSLAIASAYLVLALLTLDWQNSAAPTHQQPHSPRDRAARLMGRAAQSAPGLLAALCLLIGYSALALRGAARYDDRTAGLALDSFSFWFVLLAAVIPLAPLFRLTTDGDKETWRQGDPQTTGHNHPLTPSPPHPLTPSGDLFRFAWLYPLARLYSLGPWNSGWSFATLLLGGALALWCACSALGKTSPFERAARVQPIYLALALSGLGLSTSAGVAAACYNMLTYLVLVIGQCDWRLEMRDAEDQSLTPDSQPPSPISDLLPWLLSSAIPLSAPFVAAWMLIGAGVSGGVALLAGVAWLVALLHGLVAAQWTGPISLEARRPLLIAGGASLLLGIGAPPIVRALIQPVVAQLQGGLTPYGEVNIWPWVGLATSDSAHTQVTTLPSLAIALLMLVLSALVYVVARLREERSDDQVDPAAEEAPTPDFLSNLRDEVPWLAGLIGSNPRSQRRPGDGE